MASGCYSSAGAVVHAGLHVPEMPARHIRTLHDSLKAGEDSGLAVPFNAESLLERMRTAYTR
ncbi:MAG: type II toxin-antitoxin system ParD family antitoxin [Alcaligenaceae bacterium]|nr:type II toxin-antitoxin system ParD family antitoxin [Alcaligenaceae bacterium]